MYQNFLHLEYQFTKYSHQKALKCSKMSTVKQIQPLFMNFIAKDCAVNYFYEINIALKSYLVYLLSFVWPKKMSIFL